MPWKDNILTDTVVPSAARTTSGTATSGESYGRIDQARVQVNVTAVSGVTPTLDVVVEGTVDGTNWDTLGTFTQKTAIQRQVIDIANLVGDKIRVRWTVGGTAPSFTFSVVVVAEG